MRLIFASALALTVVPAIISAAAAQPGDERPRSLELAARNELGVLEYCQAQGMVDETVVAKQREMVERLPGGSASSTAGSPEQDLGRSGFLAFGERQVRFEESARAQGLTLKTACENRAAVSTTNARQ